MSVMQTIQKTAAYSWFGTRKADPVTTETWLPAAKRGERGALSEFYDAYYQTVWKLCRRLLYTEADAEDALQTTFVRAFESLPKFRGEGSVKTWLYRIAVNESMNLLRKRATAPLTFTHDTYDGETTEKEFADANDGERVAEQIAVRALLENLKPDHRMILVLRYWEDMAYEEISSALDLPMATVKMRLHRAKEEFRRLYSGDAEAALFAD